MPTSLENKIENKSQLYPNYLVIMHNDDVHTFDYVIDLLCRTVSAMTPGKAEGHALEIHNNGTSIVAVAPFEIAEFYYEVFITAGMKTSLEPDK